jgi:hypothetical protein
MMDNYTIGVEDITGQVDYLMTPRIDFSNAGANANLSFDVAYSQVNSSSNDRLRVKVSTDCGQNWVTVYNKAGSALSNGTYTGVPYTPSAASDWRTENVWLGQFAWNPDMIVMFETTSGGGNNVFIDNVALANTSGVSEAQSLKLSISPNPAKDYLSIETTAAVSEQMDISVTDMFGKVISRATMPKGGNTINLDLSAFAAGTYMVRMVSGTVVAVEKFNVIK